MYLSIRKEEVKKLPKHFQDRASKLFPTVKFDKFDSKYEQSFKLDKEGNYIRVKREPKWKYKIYLCGSYRFEGKARNKQILLNTIYYWDIVDDYINKPKEQHKIWNITSNKYKYYEFDETWKDIYELSEGGRLDGDIYWIIKQWVEDSGIKVDGILSYNVLGIITNKLKSEIEVIEDDYKTTTEYIAKSGNENLIKELEVEINWLNKNNGFV